jgi:pimeloyl-ACP methyl ester carboxylesterase
MECDVDGLPVHYDEHGEGVPALVLHGAGVDHRELRAALEPAFAKLSGYRRIYPDLPGMGRTPAPSSIQSADDVLDVLLGLADRLVGERPFVVIGHSAGAYYAQAIADARRADVAGLALICPLIGGLRDMPEHVVVHASDDLGDEYETPELSGFRDYFVVHTPQTLERYVEHVEPATAMADDAALERIGARWDLSPRAEQIEPFGEPTLVVAGRQDSTVGFAGQWEVVGRYPHATFAVLDRAGHALPHEQPDLLFALVREWLDRVRQTGRLTTGG